MDKRSDHDLLITINEQVKQIRVDLQSLRDDVCRKFGSHETRLDEIDREQLTLRTKITTLTGVASIVGGIIVFVVDKVWEMVTRK